MNSVVVLRVAGADAELAGGDAEIGDHHVDGEDRCRGSRWWRARSASSR